MAKIPQVVPAVSTKPVAGTRIRANALDIEAKRLVHILKRVGMRLRNQVAGCELSTGEKIEPMGLASIPSEEWLDVAEWYQKGVLGLLKEQRERARMAQASGLPQMSDEEYEAELAKVHAQMLREMPTEKLEQLVAERNVSSNDSGRVSAEDSVQGGAAPLSFDLSDEEDE